MSQSYSKASVALRLMLLGTSALYAQNSAWSGVPVRPEDSNLVTVRELQHVVPKAARKEMEKAEKARLEHRTDDEIGHLEKVIVIDPDYIAARNNLAVCLVKTDPRSAIAQLEAAIKVNSHHPVLFNNLAVAYLLARDWDAGERAARAAVDLSRGDASMRELLGIVLVQAGKYTAEALADLEQPFHDYPLTRLLAARVLIAQGRWAKARSYIEEYLSSGDQEFRAQAADWLDVIDRRETARIAPQ